jgi:hypothetical protein
MVSAVEESSIYLSRARLGLWVAQKPMSQSERYAVVLEVNREANKVLVHGFKENKQAGSDET